jgi:acyl-CoA synthetase (NDP forming)
MGIDVAKFDRLFNPKTAAVIGDKQDLGYSWLNSMSTFKGPVYSVQIDEREIPNIEAMGYRNFKSILDIPDDIDFVIVSVPRKFAPMVLQQCIEKSVGGATFFTSGFAETAEEEGIALQDQMQKMAREANFMLVGPNCMGLFIPGRGVRFTTQQYSGEAGPVGFIGQSGTQSMYFSLLGGAHGVKVSKAVSLGNAIVLDVPDYLEYLGQDPDTKMIGMYVEGVKNGRRFFDVLKDVCKRKPVVIWKGGQTSDGARAVSSHTASLATEYTVWESLVRQCGALPVHSLEELVDVLKGLLYIAPSTGERMGIMALTGGQAVAAVDAFAKQDFTIGPLSDSSYEELSQFFSVIGASYRNPLDISSNLPDQTVLVRILDILERDPTVDAITTELTTSLLDRREAMGEGYVNNLIDILANHRDRTKKPYFCTVCPVDQEVAAIEMRDKLLARGIPSFPTFHRSANAYRKLVTYNEFLQEA